MRIVNASLLALPGALAAAPALAHTPDGHAGGLAALAHHLHPHGLEIVLGVTAVVVGLLALRHYRNKNDR